MSDEQIIRPQTIGDVIGRAIRVCRVNILTWLPILIWPTILVMLGRIAMQAITVVTNKSDYQQAALGFGALLVGIGLFVAGKWLLLIRQLALVRLTTGFSEDLKGALKHVKERQFPILGACILCGCIFFAVIVLWMVAIVTSSVFYKLLPALSIALMIFSVIGLFVSIFFITYGMLIALVALSCEEGSTTALLSRGFGMASKCFFRTMFAGFMIGLTVAVIAIPWWLPIFVLITLDAFRLGAQFSAGAAQQPFYWQVIIAAWESLIDVITWPIVFLAYGFYYYDLRLRFEGVDVLASLEQLKLENQNTIPDAR